MDVTIPYLENIRQSTPVPHGESLETNDVIDLVSPVKNTDGRSLSEGDLSQSIGSLDISGIDDRCVRFKLNLLLLNLKITQFIYYMTLHAFM